LQMELTGLLRFKTDYVGEHVLAHRKKLWAETIDDGKVVI